MLARPRSTPVPAQRGALLVRLAQGSTVLMAGGAAGVLARRVLAGMAAGGDRATLARALPGPVGAVVGRFAVQPLLPATLVALLPLAVWIACGGMASLLRADAVRTRRWQALVWLASACVSAAAIATGMTAAKQGMAALGYALGWPALASLAAVLWASPWSRLRVVTMVSLATLAGLVVRALPVGWPGENSLSWWAMLPARPHGQLLLALVFVCTAVVGAVAAASRRVPLPVVARLAMLTLVPALLLRVLPAFEHYGFEKHAAALASEINTSYFQVASGIGSRDAFMRGYAANMGAMPMHLRTHPPGWPLLFRTALDAGGTTGGDCAARWVAAGLGARWHESDSLAACVAERPLRPADVAGLWLLVGLLALAVTALPAATYFLARAFAAPEVAIRAAACAALLPATLLFFPDVDVLHPVLYALAAGAWLRRGRHVAWALVAGVLAALLAGLSFGNLALYPVFAALVVLGWNAAPVRMASEGTSAVLLLLPLAGLAVWAQREGMQPAALYVEAMHQHHVILAHRTRFLWLWLNWLEAAVALGVPTVLWLACRGNARALWAGACRATLQGGPLLVAAVVLVLLVLDVAGQNKGESGRLWMGFFPLVLAGAVSVLAERERDAAVLALLLGATLVVLKGFYVFVWLYLVH